MVTISRFAIEYRKATIDCLKVQCKVPDHFAKYNIFLPDMTSVLDRLIISMNKTPAKASTPSAEKKIGTRWSFVEKVNE